MRDYNKLLERYNKAEVYFADETIPIEAKVKQNDNIIKLHQAIIAKGMEIIAAGYRISDEEYEFGFRQIQFFDKGE